MTRSHATVALTALCVVFVLGVLDYATPPHGSFVSDLLIKVVSAILIGVVIGLILYGFKSNGDGDDTESKQ